ncbi:MAG TPA: type II toxin-antitoxin system VapC family toxin [Gemmataceae bacterium]|jgi:PIN domain nuclease of toxin-antitoxin system
MKLLLDTHVFLWYVLDDPQLPPAYRAAIRDITNKAYLSAASIWEMVLKHGKGKIAFPEPPATYMPKQRMAHQIDSLPIIEEVLSDLAALPNLHRDPFDRILMSQALHHGLMLVTVDKEIRTYSSVPQLPES